MKEFATHHTVLKSIEGEKQEVALAIAHHDDEKMFNLESMLAAAGVRVRRIVLTNGDGNGRRLPGYTAEELPNIRWKEGTASGENSGIAAMDRIDIPDGQLAHYRDQAYEFAQPLVAGASAIFATSSRDKHPDHRAAHQVAVLLGRGSIPVHGMDTLNGLDMDGIPLENGLYIPLTRRRARQERQSYLLNGSQTDGLPVHQRREMFDALGMTRRRGAEIGMRHAAVIFPVYNTRDNPLASLGEIFRAKPISSSQRS